MARVKSRQAKPPSAEIMEIAERNLRESPLLRLPRELRDKIWKLAVGGRTLRFLNYPSPGERTIFGRKLGLCVCYASGREKAYAIAVGEWAEGGDPAYSHDVERRCTCGRPYTEPYVPLELISLLQTSRQIYCETKLLPFQQHDFVFSMDCKLMGMKIILHALTRDQRRAIRSIIPVDWHVKVSPRTHVFAMVKGLEELTYCGMLREDGSPPIFFERVLPALMKLPLKEATVLVTKDWWLAMGDQPEEPALDGPKKWARNLEQQLMQWPKETKSAGVGVEGAQGEKDLTQVA